VISILSADDICRIDPLAPGKEEKSGINPDQKRKKPPSRAAFTGWLQYLLIL